MSANAIISMIVIFAIVYGGLAYFINLSLKGED
jgi:hypothetical protein